LNRSLHLLFQRVEQEELLDMGRGSEQDVAENLSEMQQINDRLGGTRALTRHLYPRLMLHNHPVSLVDLGTGGAGLPLALARWARRIHLSMRILAVDCSERNLAIARRSASQEEEIRLLQADALRLPLTSNGVDYVISSLFLHHLSPGLLVTVLRHAPATDLQWGGLCDFFVILAPFVPRAPGDCTAPVIRSCSLWIDHERPGPRLAALFLI
jgi:hypothetical protein